MLGKATSTSMGVSASDWAQGVNNRLNAAIRSPSSALLFNLATIRLDYSAMGAWDLSTAL